MERQDTGASPVVVGAARLELPSATTIEAIMHFRPDSPAAAVFARSTFAEIGAFATHPDLTWPEVFDVLDTIAGAVVQLAGQYGIEDLWVFPRYSMMGLVLAEIPPFLPPYSFTLCADVAGWNEDSNTLQKIRRLRMKDLPVDPGLPPTVYRITPAHCAADLDARLALRKHRQQEPNLPHLLRAALRRAHQQMAVQIAEQRRQHETGAINDVTSHKDRSLSLKRAG